MDANVRSDAVAWLKPGQVEQLRDAAHDGRHGRRDDALLALLYDTGLRRSEAAKLTRGMLDLDDGVLRLPGGPKVQKDYPTDDVPPPATIQLDRGDGLGTRRALRAYLDGRTDGPLFESRKGGPLTGKAINDAVGRAAERAGVEPFVGQAGRGDPADVSAHTLRHSVAYRMLREGEFSIYDVKKRLRHESLTTTDRAYSHFDTV
jgi:integrase